MYVIVGNKWDILYTTISSRDSWPTPTEWILHKNRATEPSESIHEAAKTVNKRNLSFVDGSKICLTKRWIYFDCIDFLPASDIIETYLSFGASHARNYLVQGA